MPEAEETAQTPRVKRREFRPEKRRFIEVDADAARKVAEQEFEVDETGRLSEGKASFRGSVQGPGERIG
ncbi:hypothetical protein L596_016740 [Steinernema carpocapsae]|uniref:Uncharacterized protein n=1 Tax=Steinernema carpocapsae TaxID=34508 RepID=A0A4U5NJV1_STECR|nr:hypothetical protein L596_016740 [Steinernema carpocapsae]